MGRDKFSSWVIGFWITGFKSMSHKTVFGWQNSGLLHVQASHSLAGNTTVARFRLGPLCCEVTEWGLQGTELRGQLQRVRLPTRWRWSLWLGPIAWTKLGEAHDAHWTRLEGRPWQAQITRPWLKQTGKLYAQCSFGRCVSTQREEESRGRKWKPHFSF